MTTPQMTHGPSGAGRAARRLTTETKSFFKTSEFWTYLAAVLAILIAGNAIEGEEGGTDFFAADKVWFYVTLLTIGYLVSRGIAKSGVRDPYWHQPGGHDDGNGGAPLAERVKAAAHVLTDGDAALVQQHGQGGSTGSPQEPAAQQAPPPPPQQRIA
jgi:hypothetical protein